MLVQIMSIAQALSFETGESYSYVTLMLPTGKEVRATVADETIAELTSLFMGSGSPAAQEAAARVQASLPNEAPPRRAPARQAPAEEDVYASMARPPEDRPQERSFTPVGFADDEVPAFGGDFAGEDSAQLQAIEQSLAAAEGRLAHAIGDTSTAGPAELRQMVARLQQPAMPVPNILESPRRQAAHRVEADAFGNPVITGAGLVDPRSLMGGDTEGEEDAGQI